GRWPTPRPTTGLLSWGTLPVQGSPAWRRRASRTIGQTATRSLTTFSRVEVALALERDDLERMGEAVDDGRHGECNLDPQHVAGCDELVNRSLPPSPTRASG